MLNSMHPDHRSKGPRIPDSNDDEYGRYASYSVKRHAVTITVTVPLTITITIAVEDKKSGARASSLDTRRRFLGRDEGGVVTFVSGHCRFELPLVRPRARGTGT